MTAQTETPTGDPVVNGEVVENDEAGSLVVRPATSALAVTPAVKATELAARLDVIREAMNTAMTRDVDYGVVPGTSKPTLLKPGAEKLSVLFQLDVQLDNEKVWGPEEHLTVISRAQVFHAPTGARLGYGEGICTTRERKYAYRKAERVCPNCGKPAVIKGKAEYGGGWLCWKKRDGCDSKWPDGAQEIEGQVVGDIENPDLPDLWNTVMKMAEKRARVDAVLAVTGASALFTQDVEDAPQNEPPPPPSPPAPQVAPVTVEDIKELRAAAKGLRVAQIKLAFSKVGLSAPDPFVVAEMFAGVPQSKAVELTEALSGVPR